MFDCGGGGKHHVPILSLSDPHRARPQGVHEADDGPDGHRALCPRDEHPRGDAAILGMLATHGRDAVTPRRHVH